MGIPRKVSRVQIPGLTKFNAAMDLWRAQITWLTGITGSGTVTVRQGPSGPVIVGNGGGMKLAVCTTQIGAGSGTGSTFGSGTVSIKVDTDSGVGATGLTGIPVKSYLKQTVGNGALVFVAVIDDAWQVVGVADCAVLGT